MKIVTLSTKMLTDVQYVYETEEYVKSPYNTEDENNIIDALGINQFVYILSDKTAKEEDFTGQWVIDPNNSIDIFGPDWGAVYTMNEILSTRKIIRTNNRLLAGVDPLLESDLKLINRYAKKR